MAGKQPTTLYIIGNGFDLHHKLDTWYSSFGLFLRDNHPDIYEYFLKYFGFPELDEDDPVSLKDPLWSDFEANLATLDSAIVLDEHSEFAANPASAEFSDKDWNTISVYVGQIRDDLTIKMLDIFKDFILNVEYPPEGLVNILNIDTNAIFFNFNYTKSLEYYYQIPQNQILYIHNSAYGNNKLILGHGMNPKEFERKDEEPPAGLNDEGLERWTDAQAQSYDISVERGRDELNKYFTNSFKATSKLIRQNDAFFNSLQPINKIYVLGHSLADVDKAYFEKILEHVSHQAIWILSYHNPAEKKTRINRLKVLGIMNRQIILVKMDDLIPKICNKVQLFIRVSFARTRCFFSV